MRFIGKNAKFPLAHGEFCCTFSSLEVGSEWMDGILQDNKQMKLDLDETWKMNVWLLDERFLPFQMNELCMKTDVLWSFGRMNFVDLNEQKYDR
jgi:hypothetical protein